MIGGLAGASSGGAEGYPTSSGGGSFDPFNGQPFWGSAPVTPSQPTQQAPAPVQQMPSMPTYQPAPTIINMAPAQDTMGQMRQVGMGAAVTYQGWFPRYDDEVVNPMNQRRR